MISVVVPTLDEAQVLPALLSALRRQRDVELECVVADGGSRDGTPGLARRHGAHVVTAPRGRARQLNAGAQAAHGDWLLFLHADSGLSHARLLHEALAAMQTEGARGGLVAGHFALRFVRSQPGFDRLFEFLEAKSASNRPYSINGDQGLLIRREDFLALGGYDESLPFFEDQRIAAQIFARGRWRLLPGRLETSARRFEVEGHRERYTLMAMMMGMHAAGIEAFFREAPALYAAQRDARRLELAPFRRLAIELLRRGGPRVAAQATWRCGRLARENAWQLALLQDLRHGHADGRSLRVFDRRIAPLLDNAAADAVAALLVALWFLLVLPLQDQPRSARPASATHPGP